ncbi:MAG: glycoside hydrolase family 32 protein [Clostridium sp.]
MIRNKFIEKINNHKKKYIGNVNKDKFRNKYHIMAPIGWINDPNGLCQFNGEYHVFYQYSPLEANGGMKFWGHYSSRDLVSWKENDVPIFPDSDWDKDGVYSGSALVKNGEVYFFYTGNVKEEGNHDYILTGREQNVIMVKTSDFINFSEKKLLLRNTDFPGNMSLHVRDPKVWEEGNVYYMILGARGKDDKGYVLLYKSDDLYNWTFESIPAGGEDGLGYMWECPDLFKLDGKNIFMFSPQGMESEGYKYNNEYQSGYTICEFESDKKRLRLCEFNELDRGFDFYAPQTFIDESGRTLMIGWMGVPDSVDHKNPTIENHWQHCLTIPRELKIIGKKIYQIPVNELKTLRKDEVKIEKIYIKEEVIFDIFESNTYEVIIDTNKSNNFDISLRENCILSYKNEVFKLSLGKCGYGRDERAVKIEKVNEVRIFSDNSSLEVFLNNGEEVFTTRIYNETIDSEIKVKGIGKVNINKWNIQCD